jgi:hypothetical protein
MQRLEVVGKRLGLGRGAAELRAYLSRDADDISVALFLSANTITLWSTNDYIVAVHGFGSFKGFNNKTHFLKFMMVVERKVFVDMDDSLTRMSANVESILKLPGAIVLTCVSLATVMAVAHQGKEAVKNLYSNRATINNRYLYEIAKVCIIILVIFLGLLPYVLITLSEFSTFMENTEKIVTYGQVSYELSYNSDQWLVGLVAYEPEYSTRFTAVGIVYILCGVFAACILVTHIFILYKPVKRNTVQELVQTPTLPPTI